MTLNANDVRNEYTASAGQTIFNYSFKIYTSSDLNVYVTPSGQECSASDLTTSYTVSGVGVEDGGSITLNTSTSSGDLVTIVSAIADNRTVDYQNNGDFRPDTVNDDFDRTVSLIKQVEDKADRSLQFPECQQNVTALTMEAPESQRYVRWKTDLSGLENADTPTVTVTDSTIVTATDYPTLRAIDSSTLVDGQVINVTNDGIAGQFVVKTGTVTDNGGTLIVFTDDSNRYVERDYVGFLKPEWFGAVVNSSGSASANATAFIAAAGVGSIELDPGQTYYLDDDFTFASDGSVLEGNMATIKTTSGFDKTGNTFQVVYLNASDCEVRNVIFDCVDTTTASNNNRIVWTEPGEVRNHVHHCQFLDVPSGSVNLQTAVGFGLACDYSKATHNHFIRCPGSVFTQGGRSIIQGNTTLNPKDVSYACNSTSAVGCRVINNSSVKTVTDSLSVHIAFEEGASDFLCQGNELYGIKDGSGISALNVAVFDEVSGGIIKDNFIDGNSETCTNPSSMISLTENYANVTIEGNILTNPPAGLTNNSAISVAANGTKIVRNTINGDTSMAGVVLIAPDSGTCHIEYNETIGGLASRLFVITGGDNGGNQIVFRGGRFSGATEGINTALNSPTNCPVWVENIEHEDLATFVNITDWGADLRGYFNTYNAYRWPHRVWESQRVWVYGNAAPTNGDWQQGDIVYNVAPAGGSPTISWVCVADGTPGTWVAHA